MITSRLEHAARQLPSVPGMAAALEFLRRPDLGALADGKYEIEGDSVFALVQRYITLAGTEPRFEAHKKYIDVQYLAEGSEIIGWAPLKRVDVTQAYDGGTDACFGSVEQWTATRLGTGELAVFFPEDAHAPRLACGAPAPVIKIVIKVAAL